MSDLLRGLAAVMRIILNWGARKKPAFRLAYLIGYGLADCHSPKWANASHRRRARIITSSCVSPVIRTHFPLMVYRSICSMVSSPYRCAGYRRSRSTSEFIGLLRICSILLTMNVPNSLDKSSSSSLARILSSSSSL